MRSRKPRLGGKHWVVVGVVVLVGMASTVGGVPFLDQETAERPDTVQQSAPPSRFVYSAKFVCGRMVDVPPSDADNGFELEPPVKPGNYATTINVHNFRQQEVTIKLNATAVGALPRSVVDEPPVPRSTTITRTLGPNQGLELECSDIGDRLDLPDTNLPVIFLDGFVRIETTSRLEVVGVYTSQRVIRENSNLTANTTVNSTAACDCRDGPDGGDDGVVTAKADGGAIARAMASSNVTGNFTSVGVGTSIHLERIEPYRVRGHGTGAAGNNGNGNGNGNNGN